MYNEEQNEEQVSARLAKRFKKMKVEYQRKDKISAKQLYESIRRINQDGG